MEEPDYLRFCDAGATGSRLPDRRLVQRVGEIGGDIGGEPMLVQLDVGEEEVAADAGDDPAGFADYAGAGPREVDRISRAAEETGDQPARPLAAKA